MIVVGNVPNHLIVGARTGFLTAARSRTYPWRRIAAEVNMGAAETVLVDLGAAPMPKSSKSGVTVQTMIEKSKTLTVQEWDITVGISKNSVDDDQTGDLDRKMRSAGDNFQRHINKLIFQVLNGGDGQTYGACYDDQDFFDSDHVDKGAQYQTAQDNENTLALSLDNFEIVWVAAQGTKNDQGETTDHDYNLLVVGPANKRIAQQIAENQEAYDTANREVNPFAGMSYLVSNDVDTNAWFLLAANEATKPLILAMKEQPNLQSAWFDPEKPQGGMFYFKFYSRYQVHYGDWRLAYQGQT